MRLRTHELCAQCLQEDNDKPRCRSSFQMFPRPVNECACMKPVNGNLKYYVDLKCELTSYVWSVHPKLLSVVGYVPEPVVISSDRFFRMLGNN